MVERFMSDIGTAEQFKNPNGHLNGEAKQAFGLVEAEPIPDDIVVIANRVIEPQKAGGLVQAMLAYSKANSKAHLTSIGWDGKRSSLSGPDEEGLQEIFGMLKKNGPIGTYELKMTEEEVKAHYDDIANNFLWPIFHEQPQNIHGEFSYDNWVIHDQINDRFADAYVKYSQEHPATKRKAWIHDYHLMLLAPKLRERGVKDPKGFFLHIPFPNPDMFNTLPDVITKEGQPDRHPRREVLEGLLGNDVIGFQTSKDASNFIQTLDNVYGTRRSDGEITEDNRGYIPIKVIKRSDETHPSGEIVEGYEVEWQGRKIKVAAYPIGIDAPSIRETIRKNKYVEPSEIYDEVQRLMRDKTVIFDASRLDPTKGIIPQLDAYDALLTKLESSNRPEDQELLDKLLFVRIVAPSREEVPAYKLLREEVNKRVEEINEKFAHRGHGNKVHYIPENVPNPEVLKILNKKSTLVAFVATEKDGMNLVAKEAVATKNMRLRVIVGSDAGAAKDFKGSAIIPEVRSRSTFPVEEDGSTPLYDESVNRIARALYGALTMPHKTARARNQRMKHQVETEDVGKWGGIFIGDMDKVPEAA